MSTLLIIILLVILLGGGGYYGHRSYAAPASAAWSAWC